MSDRFSSKTSVRPSYRSNTEKQLGGGNSAANHCAAANFKYQRGYREWELRSQELQELQNTRARSLSENPGPASPWENLRQAPRFSSLNFPHVSPLVRSSPVASCLESSLQGRKLS